MTTNRYQAGRDAKSFVSLWMGLEQRVLKSKNVSSLRFGEVTKCIKDVLSEDYVHSRDLTNVIHFLFSDHPFAKRFSAPHSVGLTRGRNYDVWFLKRYYSEIMFILAEIEDSIPKKYVNWQSGEFKNDLGVIFFTKPEYLLEPELSVADYAQTAFLYKTIEYRDVDDWEYFLKVGGGEANFKILFAKLQQDKRTIPKKFVIWYYEHFRKKKKVFAKVSQ